VRFSVTGIFRDNQNVIGSVMPDTRWEPFQQVNGLASP
jgi:hypothetical protein